MAERTTYFADVILPLAVPRLYTYRIPYEWNELVKPGQLIVVQFGKLKRYSALIRKIHISPPAGYEAKYIESLLDEKPVVNEKQFALWDWIAEYYMCTLGEIMLAAIPSALKLSSETKIILDPDAQHETLKPTLSDKEFLIIEALETREVLSMDDAAKIIEQKSAHALIRSLMQKKLVLVQEDLKEKYKPRIETFVALSNEAQNDDWLKPVFEQLEKKAFKQLELLLAFLKLIKRDETNEAGVVKKSDLLNACNSNDATLNALVKKGVFVLSELETSRIKHKGFEQKQKYLNDKQEEVYESINRHLKEKDVVLLHGITSSGKTEIYIKLIEQTLRQGKQVLYLLPEIALTTQIISRLQKHFGESVNVYHSRFSENERVEIWKNVLENKNSFITLGARSALFLPFSNLGLIIVDEEHDSSFKQQEPAPRYNARDSAIYMAHLHGAKTILGSATPSIETYYNATNGKYALVELMERFGGMQLPEIVVADIKEAKRKKLMKSHFSPLLIDEISAALKNKEQIILFQNRRGFAPTIECNTCAWTPHCVNCDVSLTYHKSINMLRCHYCGYTAKTPKTCEACGDSQLNMKGFGTEKIEEEIKIMFPEARVMRMDLDTTRSKYAYQQLITEFENRHVDILVGTQMVTKGLDFDNVNVVGILNADSMMSYPDFRSYERSFQLMAQVAGRAGRKNKRGKVIIQTHNPEHSVIKEVIDNNYTSLYKNELAERKEFNYPPFFRLIRITVRSKNIDEVNYAADELAKGLRQKFGTRVLGPEFPGVSKVRNYYLKNILLKIEREAPIVKLKKGLIELIGDFKQQKNFKNIQLLPDVDPV